MDIYETRVKRLLELIDSEYEGNQTWFARATKIGQPQVNRWLSKTSTDKRKITEGSARKIERMVGKPAGWLDVAATNNSDEGKILSLFRDLSENDKALALMQIQAIYELHKKR